MLWDESFKSWRALGIAGQPAAMLLSKDGKVLGKWNGGIPEQKVLQLIAG